MSASPAASTTALPLDDPPGRMAQLVRVVHGKRLAGMASAWEKHRSSQTVLPTIVPPASRMRVITVASIGTYPSSTRDPFAIGTPATQMLSFAATRLPASLPEGAPLMSVLTAQALKRFSSAGGLDRRTRHI